MILGRAGRGRPRFCWAASTGSTVGSAGDPSPRSWPRPSPGATRAGLGRSGRRRQCHGALHGPGDVIGVWIVPAGGVAVGGAHAHVQKRPLGQVHASSAVSTATRRGKIRSVVAARGLQDHPRQHAAIGLQHLELVGMVEQGEEGQSQLAPRRSTARLHDQPAVRYDLGVGEGAHGVVFLHDLRLHQLGDDVVLLRGLPPRLDQPGEHFLRSLLGRLLLLRRCGVVDAVQQRHPEGEDLVRLETETGADHMHRHPGAKLQEKVAASLAFDARDQGVHGLGDDLLLPPGLGGFGAEQMGLIGARSRLVILAHPVEDQSPGTGRWRRASRRPTSRSGCR